MNHALLLPIFLFLLFSCSVENQEKETVSRCNSCHTTHLDTNHLLLCTTCHKGKSPAADMDSAHVDFVPHPAHPDNFEQSCSPCHSEITGQISRSLHFTLHNSFNLFRQAFGAADKIATFLETPNKDTPETSLALAEDLLRRRCFRCHPYSQGDKYPSVTHGTGCAACHLVFSDGKVASHSFQSPGDAQCLSCHYGNYVGFDYFGRFENDLNAEYRTPYTTTEQYFRPYGIEYHQLTPDIHQKKGMVCIDCHSGQELMYTKADKISCRSCHQLEKLLASPPPRIENRQTVFILHGHDGKEHILPLLQHPAHFRQGNDISCQACHAQWTFNDFGKHYLRSDTDDFDIWENLSVQGSEEIEKIVENNNDYDKDELPPQMTDKITGQPHLGLWYKGFTMRRWETVSLGRDDKGTIRPLRPMLDYVLSWIDEDEIIRFDSVKSQALDNGMLPYVPHTTGPAGFFYQVRINQFLKKERAAAEK